MEIQLPEPRINCRKLALAFPLFLLDPENSAMLLKLLLAHEKGGHAITLEIGTVPLQAFNHSLHLHPELALHF